MTAPQVTSDAIALLLPLESASYGLAAEAVKAGFLAAANRAGISSRIRVIGHGDDGVLPALAAAADAGVALVVGPLTRDDLKTVIAMAPSRPRMLALNQTDDGSLPDNAYALALSVDNDAAQIARVARADGVRLFAVVVSNGALQRRFAAAFAAEWQNAGRAPLSEYRFDPNPELLGQLRRALATHPPDAVLLAIDGEDVALAKSFLPQGRVYAVSQIADDLSPPMLRDLEGVRYVDGGVASPTNLDLVAGQHLDLVIVVSPMSVARHPGRQIDLPLRRLFRLRLAREAGSSRSATLTGIAAIVTMPVFHWTASVAKNDLMMVLFELAALECFLCWRRDGAFRWPHRSRAKR